MEFKDYYQIMDIKRDATQDEIKRAYRKLARKYHPDVSKEPGAEARFKEVGEAYEVLKDPEKRAAYDQLGANWKEGQDFRPPPDWDQGFEFHGGGFTGGDAEQFSDFFESLFGRGGFGGRRQREFHARGEDTYAKILIDLEDAYQGTSRTITLKHTELGPDGRPQLKERTLNVRIPKGVHQGQNIRLAGQGGAGAGKGGAGDLYLEVAFKPHPFYKAEGKDVYLNLPVAPWEAALGATVKVPTLSGTVDLKIPPNSWSGRKLRLKGRGIPAKEPGDFYLVLEIVLPKADTDKAKAAYAEFEKALGFNPRAELGV
ncbi:DnaJ C-terminal domain-containing protein [Nitrosococcus watsonii]|uniref:Heat shock protein DnaJ domain protein n=1 Tax=Nitrosococcus watsoni (strain C-113) TaxID=105559 RepID=D8K5K5_NITWC|nr:DnaJ C-terminal domain-containing protein [Nitrosococcus watsonii]ADJ28182.1 heat shock protein DnaJ domain protein [Nitrosococcus watsonii C-113]